MDIFLPVTRIKLILQELAPAPLIQPTGVTSLREVAQQLVVVQLRLMRRL